MSNKARFAIFLKTLSFGLDGDAGFSVADDADEIFTEYEIILYNAAVLAAREGNFLEAYKYTHNFALAVAVRNCKVIEQEHTDDTMQEEVLREMMRIIVEAQNILLELP